MMPDNARLSPILSILIHVPDWRAATDWYAAAFSGHCCHTSIELTQAGAENRSR